ncbi:hypothetical protein Hanom_Chr10g00954091 [Helianthus anomalus]
MSHSLTFKAKCNTVKCELDMDFGTKRFLTSHAWNSIMITDIFWVPLKEQGVRGFFSAFGMNLLESI